jgi:hypothetical protein
MTDQVKTPPRQAEKIVEKKSKINVTGNQIDLNLTTAESVEGQDVNIRLTAADTISGNNVNIRQGASLNLDCESLSTAQSALGFTKTQTLDMNTGIAGGIAAQGPVKMEMSASRILFSQQDVTMDQSASVFLAGKNVNVKDSASVFVVGAKINGNIKTVFGPLESILFGAAAGMVISVIMLIKNAISKDKSSGKSVQSTKQEME